MTLGYWRISFKSEIGNKQNNLREYFEALSSIKWSVYLCTYSYQPSAREFWSCGNPKMNTHTHTHLHDRALEKYYIWKLKFHKFVCIFSFYKYSKIFCGSHIYAYINSKHSEKTHSNYNFIYFLLNICFMNLNSGFKIIWNHLHFKCIKHSHKS